MKGHVFSKHEVLVWGGGGIKEKKAKQRDKNSQGRCGKKERKDLGRKK